MILHRKNITDTYSKILQYKRGRRGGAGFGSSFLGKGGERLGLAVEEGERLGLVLVLSIFNCTAVSRGVPS
jgi:hypothetical protein